MEGPSLEPQPGYQQIRVQLQTSQRRHRAFVPEAPRVPRSAWWALALLFLMHVLETIGRWLVLAVQPQVRDEFRLDEGQMGWLSTALLLGLAARKPAAGLRGRPGEPGSAAGDRLRGLELGHGLDGTRAARTTTLQAARAAAGAGGASVTLVGLTMLMDLFPRTIRARALALFFLAVPLGAARCSEPGRRVCPGHGLADRISRRRRAGLGTRALGARYSATRCAARATKLT